MKILCLWWTFGFLLFLLDCCELLGDLEDHVLIHM